MVYGTDHPKVLSGEYVHHTKGFKTVFNKISNKRERKLVSDSDIGDDKYKSIYDRRGSKNSRYKEVDYEKIKKLKKNILVGWLQKNILKEK